MTLNQEAFAMALAAGIAAYEAAVVDNSGTASDSWIEWPGGECPVDKTSLVMVQLRAETQEKAGSDGWWPADDYYWDHRPDDTGADVIAYRLAK